MEGGVDLSGEVLDHRAMIMMLNHRIATNTAAQASNLVEMDSDVWILYEKEIVFVAHALTSHCREDVGRE